MGLLIFTFVILLFSILAYFKVAGHFNIIDKPNERSSHSYITIRGGGIIFPIAAVLWFLFFGLNQGWIIAALLLVAAISFLDDLKPLPSRLRIVAHFAAVSILFWQLHVFGWPWYLVALAYLSAIGWINAVNFMDGVNGMTAFYGLVALGTFLWVNQSIAFVSSHLLYVLIGSLLIFSFFNARQKAKAFAGDVGSVSMAFLLAWFMISLIVKTGHWEYIVFFAVYGIDTTFSILFRLSRSENIFKAHRSHLYQYLSNEFKRPHVLVSAVYAGVQAILNLIVIQFAGQKMAWLLALATIAVTGIVYLVVRSKITGAIQRECANV